MTTRAYALDQGGGEQLSWGQVEMLVKASGATTGGAFTLFEEVEPVDTPLHVHEREDELFFVLEGEHMFQVGEKEFRVGPGGLVFAPRGVPHAQRRVVPRTGRVLVLAAPAGLEGFFRALAEGDRAGNLAEAYARASEQHGITWLTSAEAAQLVALGSTAVRRYREGKQDWLEAGLPLEGASALRTAGLVAGNLPAWDSPAPDHGRSGPRDPGSDRSAAAPSTQRRRDPATTPGAQHETL